MKAENTDTKAATNQGRVHVHVVVTFEEPSRRAHVMKFRREVPLPLGQAQLVSLPGELAAAMNALHGDVQGALSEFIREHAQRAMLPAPTAPVDMGQTEKQR